MGGGAGRQFPRGRAAPEKRGAVLPRATPSSIHPSIHPQMHSGNLSSGAPSLFLTLPPPSEALLLAHLLGTPCPGRLLWSTFLTVQEQFKARKQMFQLWPRLACQELGEAVWSQIFDPLPPCPEECWALPSSEPPAIGLFPATPPPKGGCLAGHPLSLLLFWGLHSSQLGSPPPPPPRRCRGPSPPSSAVSAKEKGGRWEQARGTPMPAGCRAF